MSGRYWHRHNIPRYGATLIDLLNGSNAQDATGTLLICWPYSRWVMSPSQMEIWKTVSLCLHRSGPYTKPTTAVSVGDASNSAGDQADHNADGDGSPDMADNADDQANNPTNRTADDNGAPDTADNDGAPNTADDNGAPDTTDVTDADILEVLTQTETSRFLESNLTAHIPEQNPSAESESPPENLPNPLEQSSPDASPQVVTERFPYGNPGAPIDGMQGSTIYELSQQAIGGPVWAPFQSQCDWDVAHWAKMKGPGSSAVTDLLAIPNVRPPFFSSYCVSVAKCSLSL